MEKNILKNLLFLIRYLILSPSTIFKSIEHKKFKKEIYISFCLAALFTFIKSFFVKTSYIITFFSNKSLNNLLTFLSVPQLSLLLLYFEYFIFITFVFLFCKLFNKKANYKTLLLSLMSISGIGIIMQLLMIVFLSIFPYSLIKTIIFVIYFWVIILSILAIKITQNISLIKAVVCLVVSAIPFFMIALPLVISPYLAWLNIL